MVRLSLDYAATGKVLESFRLRKKQMSRKLYYVRYTENFNEGIWIVGVDKAVSKAVSKLLATTLISC